MTFKAAAHPSPLGLRLLLDPRVPAGVCLAVALVSAFLAEYDLRNVAAIAISQLDGPAHGTDFLNLYSGTALMLRAPASTYQFDAQQALQHSLTGWQSPPVPFFLPPHAALALAWLGWLPYGVAYLLWLGLGVACLGLSARLIAPIWPRFSELVWLGLAMLFLPALLGLAEGQTTALMLLAFAAFARAILEKGSISGLSLALLGAAGVLGWSLKPQLAWLFVAALVFARRWATLAVVASVVALLTGVAVALLTPPGFAAYVSASRGKLAEALSADPGFLPGPTLLNASLWFLGVTPAGYLVAAVLVVAAVTGFVYVWQRGLAHGDARLLQVAILPVVAVVAAPYALVHELTAWLATFWLLWRVTTEMPAARASLLWLSAGIWIAGDVGVLLPGHGGAELAALFGLGLIALIVQLFGAATLSGGTNAGP